MRLYFNTSPAADKTRTRRTSIQLSMRLSSDARIVTILLTAYHPRRSDRHQSLFIYIIQASRITALLPAGRL